MIFRLSHKSVHPFIFLVFIYDFVYLITYILIIYIITCEVLPSYKGAILLDKHFTLMFHIKRTTTTTDK